MAHEHKTPPARDSSRAGAIYEPRCYGRHRSLQIQLVRTKEKKQNKGALCNPCYMVLGIFPNTQSDKNIYYNSVLAYITPAAVQTRLKIVAAKFTTFKNLIGDPPSPTGTPPNTNSTEHTWNYVFPLAENVSTSTKPLRDERVSMITLIENALYDVYSDIPDSVIKETDTLNLGIKPKSDRKKPTLEPALITSLVVIGLKALGGGNVQTTCRTSSDNKKASKLNENTDIEFAYSLIAPGETPPATADECKVKAVVTKAKDVLELGEAAVGKKLVLFARWVYTKHKTKSGKFGTSVSITVS